MIYIAYIVLGILVLWGIFIPLPILLRLISYQITAGIREAKSTVKGENDEKI